MREEDIDINESSIDLFDLDVKEFPDSYLAFIYPLLLQQGDCLYLPAYWW